METGGAALLLAAQAAPAEGDVEGGRQLFEAQCTACHSAEPGVNCFGPSLAGLTATSGGVLFTGDLDNDFLVLDAAKGEVLYRFNTGGSIGGGGVTYERDGKQYAATVSGTVSPFFGGSGLPAVIVFALP